jgi:hypothetical protein
MPSDGPTYQHPCKKNRARQTTHVDGPPRRASGIGATRRPHGGLHGTFSSERRSSDVVGGATASIAGREAATLRLAVSMPEMEPNRHRSVAQLTAVSSFSVVFMAKALESPRPLRRPGAPFAPPARRCAGLVFGDLSETVASGDGSSTGTASLALLPSIVALIHVAAAQRLEVSRSCERFYRRWGTLAVRPADRRGRGSCRRTSCCR